MNKSSFRLVAFATLAITQYATAFEQEENFFQFYFSATAANHSLSNILSGKDLREVVVVNENTPLVLNVVYSLTNNNNIEVLADTPLMYNADFGVSNIVDKDNEAAEVKYLPATLTADYHFNDASSKFQPYIGASINNTMFFEEEHTAINTFTELDDLSLVNSFGLAAQVGADYVLNDKWFINSSTRLADMNEEASFNLIDDETSPDIIEVAPWVYSMTLDFQF